MGEKFRRAVIDFVDSTGTAARQLALWAGRTETAVRNWKSGDATPELDALERMLEKVPESWRQRFRDAWDEDETPPHVWAARAELAKKRETVDVAFRWLENHPDARKRFEELAQLAESARDLDTLDAGFALMLETMTDAQRHLAHRAVHALASTCWREPWCTERVEALESEAALELKRRPLPSPKEDATPLPSYAHGAAFRAVDIRKSAARPAAGDMKIAAISASMDEINASVKAHAAERAEADAKAGLAARQEKLKASDALLANLKGIGPKTKTPRWYEDASGGAEGDARKPARAHRLEPPGGEQGAQ